MTLREATRISSGATILLFGLWALATSWLTIGPDSKLLVAANLLAIATCVGGVLVFVRPRFGIAMTILTLVPQALSFAARNIAYALNIWPSYRLELDPTACAYANCISFYSFRWTPTAVLRTDAQYTSVGLGIDIVSTALILLFAWVYVVQGRNADV